MYVYMYAQMWCFYVYLCTLVHVVRSSKTAKGTGDTDCGGNQAMSDLT